MAEVLVAMMTGEEPKFATDTVLVMSVVTAKLAKLDC